MPKKIMGGSDLWRTPEVLWNKLNDQYRFTIDLCASEEDRKTDAYCDDLEGYCGDKDEKVVAWINPPFSLARKLIPVALTFNKVVGIYRCDNLETEVWQKHILVGADWVMFLKGRVRYEDPHGNRVSPMFPSALWGKRVGIPVHLDGVVINIPREASQGSSAPQCPQELYPPSPSSGEVGRQLEFPFLKPGR